MSRKRLLLRQSSLWCRPLFLSKLPFAPPKAKRPRSYIYFTFSPQEQVQDPGHEHGFLFHCYSYYVQPQTATDSPSDRSVLWLSDPRLAIYLPSTPPPLTPSLNSRPLPLRTRFHLPSPPVARIHSARLFARSADARTDYDSFTARLATSAAAHRALRSVVTHPQKPRLSTMHLPHTRAIQQSNSPAGAVLKQRGAFAQRWYI